MKLPFTLALLAIAVSAGAQSTITPQVMQVLSGSYANNSTDKALRNAISANKLRDLAGNQENSTAIDTYFSVEVPYSGISDQKSSGRCWLWEH